MLTSENIKSCFLDYYRRLGHHVLPSDSLVPQEEDSTLLFMNSVMARFKGMFSGAVTPDYSKIVTFQRVLRVGGRPTLYGKHMLEEVGKGQNLTLHEQLGTCVFGEYSRSEAIENIWCFLTKEISLSPKNLVVTVFKEDEETLRLWTKIGIPRGRIACLSEGQWREIDLMKVCGPCTHFVYDRGTTYKFGCGRKNCGPRCSCGRFLDLGDTVFFEYSRESNELCQLSSPNIDTGLGLERITMVVEGVASIFEISSFVPLLKKVEKISGCTKDGLSMKKTAAIRAIIDHARLLVFAITDGVYPGNIGRQYVLRKVLRRAVRCGWELDIKQPFLYKLVDTVVDTMKCSYPILLSGRKSCYDIIRTEEEKFLRTLRNGEKVFSKMICEIELGQNLLSSENVFKLYDTCGLPLEFIKMLAEKQHLQVDEKGFQLLFEQQKQRSYLDRQQKT